MGCSQDQYNIEDISFSQGDLFTNEEDKEKTNSKDTKKKKKTKRKSKNKNKQQKSDISPISPINNTIDENEEEENISSENINETETENSKTNENESGQNSQSERKENSKNEQSNNTNKDNSSTSKNNDNQTEKKDSSASNTVKSSDKKTIKIDSSSKSNLNSKSNKNNNNDESKSSLNKEGSKENNKESDKNSKDISDNKNNKDNENDKNKNNVIVNEDWLEGFVNETNTYYRLNHKTSISPTDPILSELITSKEKQMILSSEDIISYHKDNPSKKYKVLDLLGSGSFGKVFKAVNTLTKNLVAIKKTKKYLKKNIDGDETYVNVKNEIEILKKLSHPNIVKIYEVYDIREYYFQINEYCKYTDLYNYFKFHLSEKQICIILYQILSGVLYLHENNIIHRDIKLENIMVDHIEKDQYTSEPYFFIKIADFGSSKYFTKEKKENQIIGTCYYIAPEVIKKNYNEKCDIWSVGVVLYMLIAKKAPFEGKDPQQIFEKITDEEYNKHSRKLLDFSDEVRDLLDKLLEKNVKKRLSAREALDHPWFKKYHGRAAFSNFKFEDFNLILDKLFNVKQLNKLQDLVISYLVHNSPSNDENIKIMKIFRYLNTSGTCKLTREELKKGLYRYRLKSEVNKMVDELFTKLEIKEEKDYIEYEKFIALCVDKNNLFTKENLKDVFNFINYDKGEGITAKKIMKVFNINPEEISEAVFNTLIIKKDNNNDMVITYSEFENIVRG